MIREKKRSQEAKSTKKNRERIKISVWTEKLEYKLKEGKK